MISVKTVVVVLMLIVTAGFAGAQNYRNEIRKLEKQLRGGPQERTEAVDRLATIASSPDVKAEQRMEAASAAANALMADGKGPRALKLLELQVSSAQETGGFKGIGALNSAARHLANLGALEEAEKAVAAAAELAAQWSREQDRAEIVRTRGDILKARGEFAEALKEYRQVPTMTNSRVTLTHICRSGVECAMKMGRKEKAAALLQQTLLADPRRSYPKALSPVEQEAVDAGNYLEAARWAGLAGCQIGDLGNAAEARARRVNYLLVEDRIDQALAESRTAFSMSPITEMEPAIEAVVKAFEAADGAVVPRVKGFLDYQRLGPAGQDGEKGTEDDLENPLADVPFGNVPQDEFIEELMAEAGIMECTIHGHGYLALGRPEAALAELRAAYAIASGRELTQATYGVATAIKAMDGHAHRANWYLSYHKHGPSGPDGEPGSDDDLIDPLADEPWNLAPERASALEEAIKACPGNYEGLRRKGYLLMIAGKPREALRVLVKAYRVRPPGGGDLAQAVTDVAVAIKAVDGHVRRANQYLEYRKYGPAGPDGKAGTLDDIADPTADILAQGD